MYSVRTKRQNSMLKTARLSVKISEVEQIPGFLSRRRMTRALVGSPSGGTVTTVGRKYQTTSLVMFPVGGYDAIEDFHHSV